jgi:hypothetical protein
VKAVETGLEILLENSFVPLLLVSIRCDARKFQATGFISMRFEVLTAANKPLLVFWVVTPRGLVGRYKYLE